MTTSDGKAKAHLEAGEGLLPVLLHLVHHLPKGTEGQVFCNLIRGFLPSRQKKLKLICRQKSGPQIGVLGQLNDPQPQGVFLASEDRGDGAVQRREHSDEAERTSLGKGGSS